MPHSLAGAFIFLAFLASAAPARSAQTLEGFGIFKFGLSPSQARALPGQSFGRYAAKNLLNQDSGAMASKISAKIYGVSYNFDLFFNSHQALNEISLANEITTSQGDCEIRFLTLLAQLEKSYGGLSPVYPQQKKNDQDLLPILVVWKSGAGASRYQLATVFLNDETAYVWNARKVLGARYLDAATFWSGGQDDDKAVCLTQIDFKA
jgi:hypothetical protein